MRPLRSLRVEKGMILMEPDLSHYSDSAELLLRAWRSGVWMSKHRATTTAGRRKEEKEQRRD